MDDARNTVSHPANFSQLQLGLTIDQRNLWAYQCIQCQVGNLVPTNAPMHRAGFNPAPPYPYRVNAVEKAKVPEASPTRNGARVGPTI
jgi:hypothetical protein